MKHFFNIFMLSAFAFMVFSCSKDSQQVPINNTLDTGEDQISKDESTAFSQSHDVLRISQEAINGNDNMGGKINKPGFCAQINNFPQEFMAEIDYGDGCLGGDGIERSGVIVVYYKPYFNDYFIADSMLLQDYGVHGYVFNGLIKNQDLVINLNGNLQFSRELENITIDFQDGTTFLVSEASQTIVWTEGTESFNFSDNVYEVTGNSNGVSRLGVPYTGEIDSPLVYKTDCWENGVIYPSSGSAVVNTSLFLFKIDYGTGSCDKNATATLNDVVYAIALP